MLMKAKVKVRQQKFSFRLKDGILEISTKSPAENSRANQEIIKELTKVYGRCRIVKGLKSSKKIIEI